VAGGANATSCGTQDQPTATYCTEMKAMTAVPPRRWLTRLHDFWIVLVDALPLKGV